MHGTGFMTVEHDLWTNSSKSCIVGASCSFIDRHWRHRHLALLAQVKNDGHYSDEVAQVLDEELMDRFGLDLNNMAHFTISDTAAAARKISTEFDSTMQTDCAMHALNLCIGYGIGLKENVRNVYVLDPETEAYVKKRRVVTEGGAFPEGSVVIRKLRALNSHFKSPERCARLKEVQQFHKLPELAAPIDVDVRVASTIKRFRRFIVNYPAFRAFFQSAGVANSPKDVFNNISRAEWELVTQMEAVLKRVADLALVESQSSTILPSTLYVLLRVASTKMNSYKFSSYCLDGARDPTANEKNFPRVQLRKIDLAELTHRCIARTLHHIAERLPKPSYQMGMALLVDPRTKAAAKNLLTIPDRPEAYAQKILAETKALMRTEHRVFYKALHANTDPGDEAEDSASSLPRADANSSSDTEAELVYGEEVSHPVEATTAEASLNAKADAVLEEWFGLRVDWAEVVKKQYANKDELDKVLAKLSVRGRKRNIRVWNVEQLCGRVDICRWFAEIGQDKYPSISKIARVWLGRGCSTAFQERVFSTGSFVMSALRTRTDNERAQRQLILRHNRLENARMEREQRRTPM